MAKGGDCKSPALRLRRFESYLSHQPSLAAQASARQARTILIAASEGSRVEAQSAKTGWVGIFHYVYLLESESEADRFYVGATQDLKARLAKHNSGEAPHTSKYVPWRLKTYLAFSDKEQAFAFEKYLKSPSGRAFSKKRL